MVSQARVPCADGPGDLGPHGGVQAHAPGHDKLAERLGDADADDGADADKACPDDVYNLVNDVKDALHDLRPGEPPEVLGDAAYGQIAGFAMHWTARRSSFQGCCGGRQGRGGGGDSGGLPGGSACFGFAGCQGGNAFLLRILLCK